MQRVLVGCLLVSLIFVAGSASGQERFTGETASHVDWAVKSCEFKGSDRARKLVDETRAKSEARFTEEYMKGFNSKLLSEGNAGREATARLCTKMKEWYGNAGTRIEGLVAPPAEAQPAVAEKKTQGVADRPRRRRGQ
jgi:hypothetical protein